MRRTKADIAALKAALYEIIKDMRPMTVRQVFYQAVSRGLIRKTEQEYKNSVGRLLTQMRKANEMPWQWLADNTRWMRKPDSYDSMTHMLKESQQLYRRALWNDQPAYVEIWLEKDALAGVLFDVTSKWDVPLMVTRGYPSYSFLASAAEAIREKGKLTHLYYFGDHDPSGVDIPRHIEDQLGELINPLRKSAAVREEIAAKLRMHGLSTSTEDVANATIDGYAGVPTISFECVAVTEGQIIDLDLQTRPTKKTDTRAKNFEGESVEVDAIPPDLLRQMAEDCITRHIDDDLLESTRRIEEAERESLKRFANRWTIKSGDGETPR